MDPVSPIGIQPTTPAPTSGAQYTGPFSTTPTTGTTPAKTPGKDDFLQLLVTQLRHQDPLNPMQDRDFITQLAQFNALEEMQKLNAGFTSFQASQDVQIAAGLLGKTVDYQGSDGSTQTGQVSQVGWHTGVPKLTISDKEVDLSQIVSVR